MNGRRRCELEQAIIHAMVLGEYALYNALGELDWEFEKELNMEDDTVYDLNHYARLCHEANKSWWPQKKEDRNKGELLMLCVSELAEAMEGHRKDKMDDKLPHRKMAEVELVDFLIRAFDMAGGLGWEVGVSSGTDLTTLAQGLAQIHNEILTGNFAECLLRASGHLVHCYSYTTGRRIRPEASVHLALSIEYVLVLMHAHGMDIQGAFDEKMAFNAHRADHKLEHRAGPGGKKY